jgi:hypothetical protein
MNKVFRFVLLSSALALLGLNGCDSEVVSEKADTGDACTDVCTPDDLKCDGNAVYVCQKDEEDESACYAWAVKEKCAKGKSCDETRFERDAVECSDTCDEESLYRCSLKGLLKCTPDANGCASWVVVDRCEGKTCDPDSLECVDDDEIDLCPNACDPDKESKKCDGEDLYECQESGAIDGCYTWTHVMTCDNGQHCDETSFECVDGCTEICEDNQSVRCSGDGLEECKPDENGCASWSVVDACEGGSCDPDTLKCVKPCDDECAEAEQKCSDDGDGTVSCVKDENGCLKWGEAESCGENKTCDPETSQCTDVCNPNCTEKDKKETHATWQKVCTDVNGKGCLQWVETKCKKGEKFDAGQNKCVSVCGNDCEPFTIVFLPDTQYYTRNVKKDKNGNVVKDGQIDIFSDQLKWISDYRKDYNIKAVIHLGDITDSNAAIAWQFANRVYAKYMDGLNLPYTVAPGNHDFKQCKNNSQGVGSCKGSNGSTYKRDATRFSSSGKFNNSRAKLKDRAWFKGFTKVGNSYITFKAAGIDFLVIALEYAPRKEMIKWADDLISKYPNHKVIIESHAYITPSANSYCKNKPSLNGSGQYTNGFSGVSDDAKKGLKDATNGKYMFDNLVAKHNNIILVVNGHHSGSCFRLNKGNNGNTVAEMVVDYQSENGIRGLCVPDGKTVKDGNKKVGKRDDGGAGTGWFRMLKFDPKNYTITSITTSSLGKARFGKGKAGKEWLYCKSYYPQDPKKKPSYKIDMDAPEHRFTQNHAFVANFDFVTPVDHNRK